MVPGCMERKRNLQVAVLLTLQLRMLRIAAFPVAQLLPAVLVNLI
jgi:uncharacterized membrane protein YqgA involved in biofilm formation